MELTWSEFVTLKLKEALAWSLENAKPEEIKLCNALITDSRPPDLGGPVWNNALEGLFIKTATDSRKSDSIRICALNGILVHATDEAENICSQILRENVGDILKENALLVLGIIKNISFDSRELIKQVMDTENPALLSTAEIVFSKLPSRENYDEYLENVNVNNFSKWLDEISPDDFIIK